MGSIRNKIDIMNLRNSFITISRCKYSESFFWQGQIIQFYFEAEKKQFLWLVTKVLITLRWHSNKSETVSNYCISHGLAPQLARKYYNVHNMAKAIFKTYLNSAQSNWRGLLANNWILHRGDDIICSKAIGDQFAHSKVIH